MIHGFWIYKEIKRNGKSKTAITQSKERRESKLYVFLTSFSYFSFFLIFLFIPYVLLYCKILMNHYIKKTELSGSDNQVFHNMSYNTVWLSCSSALVQYK